MPGEHRHRRGDERVRLGVPASATEHVVANREHHRRKRGRRPPQAPEVRRPHALAAPARSHRRRSARLPTSSGRATARRSDDERDRDRRRAAPSPSAPRAGGAGLADRQHEQHLREPRCDRAGEQERPEIRGVSSRRPSRRCRSRPSPRARRSPSRTIRAPGRRSAATANRTATAIAPNSAAEAQASRTAGTQAGAVDRPAALGEPAAGAAGADRQHLREDRDRHLRGSVRAQVEPSRAGEPFELAPRRDPPREAARAAWPACAASRSRRRRTPRSAAPRSARERRAAPRA